MVWGWFDVVGGMDGRSKGRGKERGYVGRWWFDMEGGPLMGNGRQ